MVGCKGGRDFGVGFAAWAVKMRVKITCSLRFYKNWPKVLQAFLCSYYK